MTEKEKERAKRRERIKNAARDRRNKYTSKSDEKNKNRKGGTSHVSNSPHS